LLPVRKQTKSTRFICPPVSQHLFAYVNKLGAFGQKNSNSVIGKTLRFSFWAQLRQEADTHFRIMIWKMSRLLWQF